MEIEKVNSIIYKKIPRFRNQKYYPLYKLIIVDNLISKSNKSSLYKEKQKDQNCIKYPYLTILKYAKKSRTYSVKFTSQTQFNEFYYIEKESEPSNEMAIRYLSVLIHDDILPKILMVSKMTHKTIKDVLVTHLEFCEYLLSHKEESDYNEQRIPLLKEVLKEQERKRKNINIFVGQFDMNKFLNKKQTIVMNNNGTTKTFLFKNKVSNQYKNNKIKNNKDDREANISKESDNSLRIAGSLKDVFEGNKVNKEAFEKFIKKIEKQNKRLHKKKDIKKIGTNFRHGFRKKEIGFDLPNFDVDFPEINRNNSTKNVMRNTVNFEGNRKQNEFMIKKTKSLSIKPHELKINNLNSVNTNNVISSSNTINSQNIINNLNSDNNILRHSRNVSDSIKALAIETPKKYKSCFFDADKKLTSENNKFNNNQITTNKNCFNKIYLSNTLERKDMSNNINGDGGRLQCINGSNNLKDKNNRLFLAILNKRALRPKSEQKIVRFISKKDLYY